MPAIRKHTLLGWTTVLLVWTAVGSWLPGRATAEIVMDKTLTPDTDSRLPGPNYQITPDLGRQVGSNQFYSFQTFNIGTAETATFSGPPTITNIISRVTGGAPSRIDGTLRSIIPGADFYFINPQGVVFGPNSRTELRGSFFTSTADYVRLGDDSRFYSLPVAGELLSADPPRAFGFTGENQAVVRFEGRGEVPSAELPQDNANIEVPDGKTIAVVSSGIELEKGSYSKLAVVNQMQVSQGRIQLAAVAAGEASLEAGQLGIAGATRLGEVTMGEQTRIQSPGGEIYIVGERFLSAGAGVEAGAGLVRIEAANSVSLQSGWISTSVGQGKSDAGGIEIVSRLVSLEGSRLEANADAGDGGTIRITTDHLNSANGSLVQALSNSGRSGTIQVNPFSPSPVSEAAAEEIKDQISAAAQVDTGSDTGGGQESGGQESEGGQEDKSGDRNKAGKAAAAAGRPGEMRGWMMKDCSARQGKKISRLTVEGRDAAPTNINDLLASPPLVLKATVAPGASVGNRVSTGAVGDEEQAVGQKDCPCPGMD